MGDETRLGSQLAGYVIESLVGRGGMGVVYLAQDLRLSRRVALKILAPEISRDENFRARFVRESRIAAGIEHPNIIPIYEAGEADGELFIAMRYVGGTDLEELIKRGGPLERGRASRIIEQTAKGLDAAHQSGLVHRDVKPANILLAPGGGDEAEDHVYVSDFGITKRLDTHGTVPSSGKVFGTLDYVAPEQIEGAPVDRRTDVYSLGCVLYQCLTGTVPFPRETEMAVLWAHVHDDPPQVTALRPDLPPGIDAVVAKAMAKEAVKRFDTAGRLAGVVRQILGTADPATSRTVPIASPPERPRRRRRYALLLIAALIAASGGVAAFLATRPRSHPAGSVTNTSMETFNSVSIDQGQLAKTVPAPDGTVKFAVGEGAIWALTQNALYDVDPKSGKPEKVLNVVAPADVEVGQGAVFVASAGPSHGGWVKSIDPSTQSVLWRRNLDVPPTTIKLGPAGVWVFSLPDSTIVHLDLRTGDKVRQYNVGVGAAGVALNGYLWVINNLNGTLQRIVAPSDHLGHVMSLPGQASAVAAGGGGVWVLDSIQHEVYPFDSVSGAPSGAPVRVRGVPTQIIEGAGHVWVASGRDVWSIATLSRTPSRIRTPGRVVEVQVSGSLKASTAVADIWVLVARG